MVKCEVAKRTLKLYSWVPSLLQVCSSLKGRRFNCGIRVQLDIPNVVSGFPSARSSVRFLLAPEDLKQFSKITSNVMSNKSNFMFTKGKEVIP
jgi:hypothetical protein